MEHSLSVEPPEVLLLLPTAFMSSPMTGPPSFSVSRSLSTVPIRSSPFSTWQCWPTTPKIRPSESTLNACTAFSEKPLYRKTHTIKKNHKIHTNHINRFVWINEMSCNMPIIQILVSITKTQPTWLFLVQKMLTNPIIVDIIRIYCIGCN